MSDRAFLPHSVAVATFAIQAIVTVQLFAIARAPGWHRARTFGWVALTAGLYSAMYALGTLEIRSLPVQAVHWEFNIALGALNAAAWCRFAWAPDARTWGDLPPWLYRLVVGVTVCVLAIVLSGGAVDITTPVAVKMPSLGVDHLQPHTTPLGGMALLATAVLLATATAGLIRRRHEPGYGLVLAGFGAFLVAVLFEGAIAHFGWQIMFPAPIGFLAAVVPITVLLQRQFTADAERLAWLSSSLRGQLASRTEERDLAREALLRQEQLLSVGRLANGIGHQLSNPLQHVSLALLEMRNTSPSGPHTERIAEILSGVERMQEVVRRLRDITDTETRYDVTFPVARAVLSAATVLTPSSQPHVAVRTTVDDEQFEVLGDERALVRCFAALVLNAAEAAARGVSGAPRVDIRVRRTDDGLVAVDIRDSGPGFPADVLAHVGEPFLPGGEKLGLGLHAVHRIVHAHGGTVTVGNLPSGGALVSVLLPSAAQRATVTESAAERVAQRGAERRALPVSVPPAGAPSTTVPHRTRASSSDARQPGQPATVLVVDDELLVRQVFARLLEREGYHVLTAEDGRDAVAVLSREHVDLVVTDLMMPEMSGMELAQHLAAHYPLLRERLLVVCGGAVTKDAVAFVATPGLRVLEKPVTPADFVRAVGDALHLSQSA